MKSKILIFGATCMLIFVLGCVQQPVDEVTTTTIQIGETTTTSPCEDIELFFDKIECYKNLAIQERDYNICNNIKSEQPNPQVEELRYHCLYEVYAAISQDAISKKNLDICEKLPADRREYCYMYYASKIDPYICESRVSSIMKDHCFYGAATEKHKLLLCEKINDSDLRKDCGNKNINESTTLEDCNKLTVNDIKQQCLAYVAGYTNDSKLCEKVLGEWSNKCWWILGVKNADPEFCKKIDDSFERKECTYWAVRKSKDISLCNLFESQYDKEWCLNGIVMETGNGSICEMITTPFWIKKCKEYAYK